MHEYLDEILPHPEGLDPSSMVHERTYVVRAYRKDNSTMILRGAIRDQKPPHLYIASDPEPLTMHHMIIDLEVSVPMLEITKAKVVMEVHPNERCPSIESHYEKLVGVSIARGYNNRIRELFGGPRGCTHNTALLQAMAPVALQSVWSFRMLQRREAGVSLTDETNAEESREAAIRLNVNTCHVWDEHGEVVAYVRSGGPPRIPLSLEKRLGELGLDAEAWTEKP